VPDASPDQPIESSAVLAHIARKQDDLLARSLATVAECPDEDLVAQVHRLVGTLGTYQLMDASVLMRACETALLSPDTSSSDVERIRRTTLESLSEIVAARDPTREGTRSHD
jgi:hypothetical protein